MTGPPAEVLDLFAVPDAVEALPGGRGRSVRAGDLVLSPDRDPAVQAWLNPVLARLAVRLDEGGRAVRIAMPVPARDGSWVVEGWAASRYEPGTVACRDLDVTLAAGHLLHAHLASAVPVRPDGLDERTDRWAVAERLAFGDPALLPPGGVVGRAARSLQPYDDPAQLVHGDLAGNVLLDVTGTPVVIDLAPYWRPVLWASAVCVLDAVVRADAPVNVLSSWRAGRERQALLRAVIFRALSDATPEPTYEDVLDLVV